MEARVSDRGKPALCAVLGLILLTAGCQSGNPLSALNVGQGDDGQERISVQELMAYCPPVSIVSANSVTDSYQRGGDGDPSRLVWRASINDATRSCDYRSGSLAMTVAVAGRVVPGPAATPGSVSVPIRVTVYSGEEVIHDQVRDNPVALSDTAGATQFIFTDANLSVPNPTARTMRIAIGFDRR